MKKLIILFVVVLGTFTAKAQKTKTSFTAGYTNVDFEYKVNSSNEYQDNDSSTYELSGIYVGFLREIYIKPQYSVTPGILYTNLTIDGSDENLELLQVPLLFNYYPNENIYFSTGPKVEYRLDDEDLENYNKFSFSLAFGVGFKISEKLDIVANYSLQLSNSFSDSDEDYYDDVDISVKQKFFNIGIAYNL